MVLSVGSISIYHGEDIVTWLNRGGLFYFWFRAFWICDVYTCFVQSKRFSHREEDGLPC